MAGKLELFFRGSALRVTQTIAGMVVGFLLMPFLIRTLGTETYGLWVVVSSVVATYYLLDVGFNQGVTRYVTNHIHKGEFEQANRIINTALVIYAMLGACVLILSIVFASIGVGRLVEDPDKINLVQVLLVIAGLQLAIEFPSKAFPGVIGAYMRYDWIAMVRTGHIIIDGILIYFFVSNGYGLVAIAVISFVTGLASTYVYVRIANYLFQEVRYSRNLVDRLKLGELFHFSKWVFVLDTNNMLRDKIGTWSIAYFLGSATLTIYYVASRLTDFAITFLNQAVGMTMPIFTEHYAKEQWEDLRATLTRFLKLDLMLATLFVCGFVAVGEVFISLWMGEEFPHAQTWQALVVLSVGRMSVFATSPLQCILFAFNKHRISAIISTVELAAIAILCILWIPAYGILGAAFAASIPNVLARLLFLVIAVNGTFKFLSVDLILRAIAFIATVVIALFLTFDVILPADSTLAAMIARSALVTIVVVLLSLALLNRSDFAFLNRVVGTSMRKVLVGKGT